MPADGGIKFGQYVLLRRIARGGMAEVFLAQQRGLEGFDRRVAVKRILPHLADTPDFVKMFLGEARLAAQLTHPNVVHIYDFGKVENDYFIAMEYVDGVHAGQLFKQGERDRMPATLVARVGADAASALHYAHELRGPDGKPLGLVHRDVSPANIMVSYDGVVKLCDFGIAKAAAANSNLTNPGQVKGKYAYMSPEQTIASALDGRSDVFSLGICLWELVVGKTIVPRGDAVEAMRMIRDGKLPSVSQVAPATPPPLAKAISWALETKREKRATAADLAQALETFIKSAPELAGPMQLATFVRARFPRDNTGPQPALSDGPSPVRTAAAVGTMAAPGTAAAPPTGASVITPSVDTPMRPHVAPNRLPTTDDPRPLGRLDDPRSLGRVGIDANDRSKPDTKSPPIGRATPPNGGRAKVDTKSPPIPSGPTPNGGRAKPDTKSPPLPNGGRAKPDTKSPPLPKAPIRLPSTGELDYDGQETIAIESKLPDRSSAADLIDTNDPDEPTLKPGQQKPIVPGKRAFDDDPTFDRDKENPTTPRPNTGPRKAEPNAATRVELTKPKAELPLPTGPRKLEPSQATMIAQPRRDAIDAADEPTARPDAPVIDDLDLNETMVQSGARRQPVANPAAIPTMAVAPLPTYDQAPIGQLETTMPVNRGRPQRLVAILALVGVAVLTFIIVVATRGKPAIATTPSDAPVKAIDAGIAVATTTDASAIEDAFTPTIVPDAPPLETLIEIDTRPEGGLVTIGDQRRTSPAKFVLPPGKHEIVAELPGYEDEKRSVELLPGEHLNKEIVFAHKLPANVKISQTGKLSIRTTPYSEVFNGNKKLGEAPFAEMSLPVGTYTLTFKNPTRPTTTKKVTIFAGKITKLSFTLPL